MITNKTATWLAASSIISFIVVVLLLAMNHQKQTKATHVPPCSSNANACIKITEPGNLSYVLNDFRFAPNHCIAFISLPDGVHRFYCGAYKLDWIGPN